MCEPQVGGALDTENLETEICNLRTQLRRKETNKNNLLIQIDALDPDDAHYAKKAEDMDIRLNNFYAEIEALEKQIEDSETRLTEIKQQKINADTIYRFLLYFDKYYDKFSDKEKKEFMQLLVEKIEIFEQKQDDGRFLKSIKFRFPLYFNGSYVRDLCLTDESTLETAVLISRG